MSRDWIMIRRVLLVSVGLWIGTFAYCVTIHPDMLLVTIIDRCYWEFCGAFAMGVYQRFADGVKEHTDAT